MLSALSMSFVGLCVPYKLRLSDCCQDILFQLGKTEGSIDAGQMIKPALARGLQLVGATTRNLIFSALQLTPFADSHQQRTNIEKQSPKMQLSNGASNPSQ